MPGRHVRAMLAIAAALALIFLPPVPATIAAVTPIVLAAGNGLAAGDVDHGQGADQGEDQGENIGELGSGPRHLGPTTVTADNSMTSGDASGGAGGGVKITVNNYVSTACASGASTVGIPTQYITVKAGDGGNGGESGTGQGTDQAEDQGENIGQFASGGGIGDVSVYSTNQITSGPADGGKGGDVSVVFNHQTLCVETDGPFRLRTPSSSVTKDGAKNIFASFTVNITCSTTPTPLVITGGNGGAGGKSGVEQGTDQGEDQGENIGRLATGSPINGPTLVDGDNVLVAGDAKGGKGAGVVVTINNYVDGTCTPGAIGTPRISLTAGKGGVGGGSGNGQGTDQAEDQGENVGQFAAADAGLGEVQINSTNSVVSDSANGGAGGKISITYKDLGTCDDGLQPAAAADERVIAKAGLGGKAGTSGELQGEDQAEDQGENVGQYATEAVDLGPVSVTSTNSLVSGPASGGAGGDVIVAYSPDDCGNADSGFENVSGSAGNGGRAGVTGFEQGLDQAEDQGENIGQFAGGSVDFGQITVHSDNSAISGDARGGDGGGVTVGDPNASCVDASPSPDARVSAVPGSGGAGGQSGFDQGADQAEDQGENIGQYSDSVGSIVSVTHHNVIDSGSVASGDPGLLVNDGCTIEALVERAPKLSVVEPPEPVEAVACDGPFSGHAEALIVSMGSVCELLPGAVIDDTVDVLPGGSITGHGFIVGGDMTIVRPALVSIMSGEVLQGNFTVDQLDGGAGRNRVCGMTVGNDFAIRGARESAGIIDVGGTAPCSKNHAGHDLTVAANAGGASTCANGAAHLVTYNPSTSAYCRPRPGLAGQTPTSGATGVARTVRPTITFTEDVTGVSATTMRLRDVAAGTYVPATVSYDSALHRATLVPSSLLGTGRLYRVEVSTAIENADGRGFWGTTWEFRVSLDGTAPTFRHSPANHATGVSRTANVYLWFSESVTGVSGATIRLKDLATGRIVSATVTYDASLRRAKLNPSVTLKGVHHYRVDVRSGIHDRTGNPLPATHWDFWTRA
ncbi:MAG TPA: Ig-like domain-containing protein [Candidatus Limnocylindrales bacterium]|nr:Ig-like domain-containing protein [Candidatus Limnocylindrales bacterium]